LSLVFVGLYPQGETRKARYVFTILIYLLSFVIAVNPQVTLPITTQVHASTTPVEAPKTPVVANLPVMTDIERINGKIEKLAQGNEVVIKQAKQIISRESRYKKNAVGDKDYWCKRTQSYGPSHGLSQINICWHPHISIEQMQNEDFAINFLVTNLLKGKCLMWSTCPLKDG